MRVEEVFAEAGITDSNRRITEEEFSADCPGCGKRVALTEMTVRTNGRESEYACACGSIPVAINWSKMATGHYNYMLHGNVLTPTKALYYTVGGADGQDRVVAMRGGPKPD